MPHCPVPCFSLAPHSQAVAPCYACLPSGPVTAHRALAALPLFSSKGALGHGSAGPHTRQSVKPGSVVMARVCGVGSGQADVVVGKKTTGRIHITHLRDLAVGSSAGGGGGSEAGGVGKKRKARGACGDAAEWGGLGVHLWHGNPLDTLSVGQELEAVVLGRGLHHHGVLELSTRPSLLQAAKQVGCGATAAQSCCSSAATFVCCFPRAR